MTWGGDQIVSFCAMVFFLYLLVRNNIVYYYHVGLARDYVVIGETEFMRRIESLPSYPKMWLQMFTFDWDHYWNTSK